MNKYMNRTKREDDRILSSMVKHIQSNKATKQQSNKAKQNKNQTCSSGMLLSFWIMRVCSASEKQPKMVLNVSLYIKQYAYTRCEIHEFVQ